MWDPTLSDIHFKNKMAFVWTTLEDLKNDKIEESKRTGRKSSARTVFQKMNQKSEITEFIPSLLYFGYTLMIVFSFWLLTGTIGFYASYLFIKTIYSQIKID